MSVEQIKAQAQQAEAKFDEIQDLIYKGRRLCNYILIEEPVNATTIEFSLEKLEALIQAYTTVKGMIVTKVSELP